MRIRHGFTDLLTNLKLLNRNISEHDRSNLTKEKVNTEIFEESNPV